MTSAVVTFVVITSCVGAVGMWAGSRNATADTRRTRWIKFVTYILVINGVLLVASSGALPLTLLVLAIVAFGGAELSGRAYPTGAVRAGIWGAYVVVAAGAVLFARTARPGSAVLVYISVATFDGFSQITGQIAGRHRLAPRISPGKSVEGSLGGLAVAALATILLRSLAGLSLLHAGMLALVVCAASLAGDLGASAVKRTVGIKDFGTLLPGHGGVLDRFDSFLLAAPASLLVLPWH